MKELGRIKVKNGWLIVLVEYVEREELIDDNYLWENVPVEDGRIPTISITISRRKVHRDKLKNRCERLSNNYLMLRQIMKLIQDWILATRPKYIYVGAVLDDIFEKRVRFYNNFFSRYDYYKYDQNVALVECVDNMLSLYWILERKCSTL